MVEAKLVPYLSIRGVFIHCSVVCAYVKVGHATVISFIMRPDLVTQGASVLSILLLSLSVLRYLLLFSSGEFIILLALFYQTSQHFGMSARATHIRQQCE